MMVKYASARSVAWPLVFAATAVLAPMATACMMPFVAIATVAAGSMPRREGIIAVIGVWTINQLLGFTLLGYPVTAFAISWGLALGAAAIVALSVARRVLRSPERKVLRLASAFTIAFMAYEGLLYTFSLVAGGTGTFTSTIVLLVLANDAAWLIALSTLHVILTRTVPRMFGAPWALRLI